VEVNSHYLEVTQTKQRLNRPTCSFYCCNEVNKHYCNIWKVALTLTLEFADNNPEKCVLWRDVTSSHRHDWGQAVRETRSIARPFESFEWASRAQREETRLFGDHSGDVFSSFPPLDCRFPWFIPVLVFAVSRCWKRKTRKRGALLWAASQSNWNPQMWRTATNWQQWRLSARGPRATLCKEMREETVSVLRERSPGGGHSSHGSLSANVKQHNT